MCGIAGALAREPDGRPPEGAAELAAAAMVHRGPDGFGFFHQGPVALAHRRLSIIDLSEAGRQPMTNEDGQIAIVVNGEIYNHAELRADLEAKGHRFRSGSDSEVVAHLYEEVGARTPELLRGMFAFAVWDARTATLLLARDRFGEKPLYYCDRADGFVFASEIAALVADERTPTDISLEALDSYLALQYVPAPDTIYSAVKKLPPGHTLQIRCGQRPVVRRYYAASVRARAGGGRRGGGDAPRARDGRGSGAVAADVGCAAGRVPVGRHRFVDRRGVHGARDGAAGEDVFGRLQRGGARRQRAAVRAPDGRALPHRTPRAGRRSGHGRPAAQHRAPPRRAVRRHVGGADPVPVRDDPAARDGRAVGRRRRRGVRRLPPLRLGARRQPAAPAARAAAGGGGGGDGRGARGQGALAARIRRAPERRRGDALPALRLPLLRRREGGHLHARAARRGSRAIGPRRRSRRGCPPARRPTRSAGCRIWTPTPTCPTTS